MSTIVTQNGKVDLVLEVQNKGKYCVYEHIFPNGKKYIGVTNNIQKRWKDGNGYKDNAEMYDEIKKVGWENIKHNIIVDNLRLNQATKLEKYLIAINNSCKNGYNKSTGGETNISYYSKSFNKNYDLCKTYLQYAVAEEDINTLGELRDDEDFCIRANYINAQIEKVPDYEAWRNEDQLMFCVHWLTLLIYGLAGNDVSNVRCMPEISLRNIERRLSNDTN